MNPKWSINENLLQGYRRIFIGSQSFMLSVGAIVSRERLPLVSVVIMLLALYMIWRMWFPIVVARQRIVDFYKYDIESLGLDEHTYVHDEEKRAKLNAEKGLKTQWRETRTKLDRDLPCIFTLMWIVITCLSFR